MPTRKKVKSGLTADRLREILSYDYKTGEFRWRAKTCRKVVIGRIAGWLDNYGYLTIQIDGKNYKGHRLAWLYIYGEWPPDDVDHKDTVRHHNWIDNLRLATRSQNFANRRFSGKNTSGFKGASYHKRSKKFVAQIQKNGIHTYLGCFLTAEEAHAVYVAKAKEVFGEFANDGSDRDFD